MPPLPTSASTPGSTCRTGATRCTRASTIASLPLSPFQARDLTPLLDLDRRYGWRKLLGSDWHKQFEERALAAYQAMNQALAVCVLVFPSSPGQTSSLARVADPLLALSALQRQLRPPATVRRHVGRRSDQGAADAQAAGPAPQLEAAPRRRAGDRVRAPAGDLQEGRVRRAGRRALCHGAGALELVAALSPSFSLSTRALADDVVRARRASRCATRRGAVSVLGRTSDQRW